jgi:hypothetical protein
MLTRLLAVATATALMLLAGCQTLTKDGYLPLDKRVQDRLDCPPGPCFVPIDPNKTQWVAENVWVNRGGIIHFWLIEGFEFDQPAIKLKVNADPPPMVCHGSAPRIRTCDVSPGAATGVKVGYSIHVKGKPAYDPFVWPR